MKLFAIKMLSGQDTSRNTMYKSPQTLFTCVDCKLHQIVALVKLPYNFSSYFETRILIYLMMIVTLPAKDVKWSLG